MPKEKGGMGFRDLRLFNQALLAKQAWRLIQFPDSLCARLLKAKYYPHGNLADTAFIQNASPCWQGICHGLDLLKKGIVWRIGVGDKVRVWRDNWIPRGNLKITGKQSHTRIKWVSELIDPVTRTWNEELIRKILLPHDVDEVLKIRLPQSTSEDFIAWHFERSGVFLVRSVYRLAINDRDGNGDLGQSSTEPSGERKIWSVLWKANVPPKIRNFGWCLATESLGVQTNIHKRGLEVFPTCSICGMEPEDGYHAVMRCTKAKALREISLKTLS